MPITYVVSLAIVVILLCGAVRLHMSFGMYHRIKAKKMVRVDIHQVERTPHLHDFLFSKY